MSVSTFQDLCDYGKIIPQRVMPPNALLENGIVFVTEEKDAWHLTPYDSRKPIDKVSKGNEVMLLAFVFKWGFRVVDVERFNQINEDVMRRSKGNNA